MIPAWVIEQLRKEDEARKRAQVDNRPQLPPPSPEIPKLKV